MLARYADRLHDANAAGLSLYSARTAELTAGTDVEPLPVPLPFVANAPAEVMTSVRRALALLPDIADLTRPSLRHPWAFVDSPAIDLPATQAAAAAVDGAVREVSAIPELSGVLRRARTPDELDALVHVLSGPGIGLDVIDETFTELWTAATSAVLGEIAAFTAFRHPGLDVCTPEALQLPLAEIYVAAQTAAASSWCGPQAPADRRPRPARALPAPRRDGEAEGRPGAGRGAVAGADRGAGDRGAGRLDPRPLGARRTGTRSSTPTCWSGRCSGCAGPVPPSTGRRSSTWRCAS